MQARVDEEGRLILPQEVMSRLGLAPGAEVHLDESANTLRLRIPVSRLRKVYIEPTNACNLTCRTCMRNIWEMPTGMMSGATFAQILSGLRDFPRPLTVFFGGFGEPLSHPAIVEMVQQVKKLGASAELITNGTLLTEARARALIAAGLDVLWVSLDGATPESYADVRLGAVLPDVIHNIERFRDLRHPVHRPTPQIGIAFVAMKHNIDDLPEMLQLAKRLRASRFMITNVLPYTDEMRDEVLYKRLLNNGHYMSAPHFPTLHLPRMDTGTIHDVSALYDDWHVAFTGQQPVTATDRCPFIESGAVAVGWDGRVSPCLPLLYDHSGALNGIERSSRHYAAGNVNETALHTLWNSPEYVAFRQKVQEFDFSPCAICVGCNLSEKNEEDCYGSTFPTCGGCLWAQGIIQCP